MLLHAASAENYYMLRWPKQIVRQAQAYIRAYPSYRFYVCSEPTKQTLQENPKLLFLFLQGFPTIPLTNLPSAGSPYRNCNAVADKCQGTQHQHEPLCHSIV